MTDKGLKRILYLGPDNNSIIAFLKSFGDKIHRTEGKISLADPDLDRFDMLISFGYRHIIGPEIVRHFVGRIINLHISLLPFNRGADPNLWSYLEDTPKGVTIHLIDEGIDTGDILAQRKVVEQAGDTLRTSYTRLRAALEKLFIEAWPDIRLGRINALPQRGDGTFHRLKDKQPYEYLLTDGWETAVAGLIGRALVRSDEGEK